MAEVRTELGTLAGSVDGALSAEQETRWNELNTEFDTLTVSRNTTQGRLARVAELAALPETRVGGTALDELQDDFIADPASAEARGNKGKKDPWALDEIRTIGRSASQVGSDLKARVATAIVAMPQMTDKRRQALTGILERFDDEAGTLALHVLATSSPTYLRAFGKLIRGQSHLLNAAEQGAVERAMSTTTTAGGFAIPQQLDPTLIHTSDGSVNPFRTLARKVVAVTNKYYLTSAGNTAWSYDAEAAQVSDDASTFAQPFIDIWSARGFVPISMEALGDIPNAAEEVAMLLAAGKDDLEATYFATGSGTAQPWGIVPALTASAGGASIVVSATADTFAVADLYNVEEALPAKYQARAAWTANKTIYNDVRQFGTSDSHALWERIGAGRPAQLLGYDAHESSAMDGAINAAAENYVMVLGDWSNYVIADRLGMTVEFVPQIFGANGRPTGQKGWFATVRHGADSVNDGAFRMLNVT
jgi:HK97 family phage major capsid protein